MINKPPFTLLRSRRGQATTETVLLFPLFIIFIVFIIKIFGLLILNQKMEVAGFYAARRFQLQSHETEYFARTWDQRYLIKDIDDKVQDYLGFKNEGMKKFLSLREMKLNIETSGTWTKVTITAFTAPPRIKFLCNYDRDRVCGISDKCLKGYNYLCETGGQIQVVKYVGKNDRVLPYARPENE